MNALKSFDAVVHTKIYIILYTRFCLCLSISNQYKSWYEEMLAFFIEMEYIYTFLFIFEIKYNMVSHIWLGCYFDMISKKMDLFL